MYSQSTHQMKVTVFPSYEEAQSSPHENHFVWTYNIELENHNPDSVQLLSRYWCIIDAMGRKQEVRGQGVVGKQPILQPGERFEYTSEAHLTTASGIMVGSYQMIFIDTGETFEIAIPAFSLDSPYEEIKLN